MTKWFLIGLLIVCMFLVLPAQGQIKADPNGLDWSADDPLWTPHEHFKVDPAEGKDAKKYDYIVKIFATFNAGVNGPPIAVQKKEYERQLKQYTKEAVAWLKKNHITPLRNFRIRWIPDEAKKYAQDARVAKAKKKKVRVASRP